MPANISYTFIVHGGAYKEFNKIFARDFTGMQVVSVKQKAVHYYIVLATEKGTINYKKEELYKLPIMAMKEEFSNYIFFKSIKSYNNVLKIMCNGNNNPEAPYELFCDLLTPIEKYKHSGIDNTVKTIKYTELQGKTAVNTSVSGATIFTNATLNDIFSVNEIEVDGIKISLNEKLKKQKLLVGII